MKNKNIISPEKIISLWQKMFWWCWIEKIVTILCRKNYKFYFIGGCVRDSIIYLLKSKNKKYVEPLDIKDIDIVIMENGNIDSILSEIQRSQEFSSVEIKKYPPFLTSSIILENFRIDLSFSRKEEYPFPGSLPDVSPGDIETDILRRDFTMNAIALKYVSEDKKYIFYDIVDGIEDIIKNQIRIIHKKSFIDDPTRIIKALHFSAKLNFKLENTTRKCLITAINNNMLEKVSYARLANEFVNILKKGKNFKELSLLFEKYHITKFYKFIEHIVRTFVKISSQLELKNVTDESLKFPIRLFHLLYTMASEMDTYDTKFLKQNLILLNISHKERQKIYNGIKILSGKMKLSVLPLWLKTYLKVYNKNIFSPLITPKELLELGVPQGKQIGLIIKKITQLQKTGKIKTKHQARKFVRNILRLK